MSPPSTSSHHQTEERRRLLAEEGGPPDPNPQVSHLCPQDALPYFMQPLLYAQSLPLWSLLPPLLQPLQHLDGKQGTG